MEKETLKQKCPKCGKMNKWFLSFGGSWAYICDCGFEVYQGEAKNTTKGVIKGCKEEDNG